MNFRICSMTLNFLGRLLGSGPLWGASSPEIMLDGGVGVRIRDTFATWVSEAAKWVVKGRVVSARARGPAHAPTPDPPTPPDPPGGPPGGLGGSGVGAWVGPRARALTPHPLTPHRGAPEFVNNVQRGWFLLHLGPQGRGVETVERKRSKPNSAVRRPKPAQPKAGLT